MRQNLVNNFAVNSNKPKVNTIEQDTSPENESNRQSPCPSNWSDYRHVKNDTDNKSPDQTEPPTEVDPNQPTTSTGMHVPQDLCADSNAILRLPQSVPKALTIENRKSKGKCNITDTMPIVVLGNAAQLWDQMSSPPKARPPYMTWALVKPQRQEQDDTEHN